MCGIEVKRDIRDGEFKLVEINPRYGLWDEIGQYIGVDIGYIAYQDLLGWSVSPQRALRPKYRWVSLERDIPAFVEYKREDLITFQSWLNSLSGPILWTDVSLSDWRVTWFVLRGLLRGAVKRVSRRFVHAARAGA
jgi:predicted ATP-grasp superfamily ATP-dependent carboligase